MKAPQIIVIIVLAIGWVAALMSHDKDHKINVYYYTIGVGVQVALLLWGGFWK